MSAIPKQYLMNIWQVNRQTILKTISYFFMHICVAMMVAYAITQNIVMAITLSLIEPMVQAVAYFFHEKAWAKKIINQKLVPIPH